jgi:hypothetical protein
MTKKGIKETLYIINVLNPFTSTILFSNEIKTNVKSYLTGKQTKC